MAYRFRRVVLSDADGRLIALGVRYPNETATVDLERVHDHFRAAVASYFVRTSACRGQIGFAVRFFHGTRVIAVTVQQGHVNGPFELHRFPVLIADFRAHFGALYRELHVGYYVGVHGQPHRAQFQHQRRRIFLTCK